MRVLATLIFLAHTAPSLFAQDEPEVYRVYTEHPRLFLRPARLKLLKRERERQSMRWRQYDMLIAGNAAMPEPGFASGLHYAVTGDAASGKRAIEWALGGATDLRQLALVYDWCQDILSEPQSKGLALKIQKALAQTATYESVANQRNRALAAIAIAEVDQNATERIL